jgi:urease accessory protein
MHFARLLHLVDSAIPTGSFAYSYGLESSVTFGLIRTGSELRHYLYSFLQQAASLELPFLLSCCHHASLDAGLRLLAEEYDALLLVPALHRASLAQAKNWLRLLESFYPGAGLPEISAWHAQAALPLHFVPAFGLALTRLEFSPADIQTMYLHMALRDQISAAIRLGVIGPMEGHRLQHDFYGVFDELLAQYAGRGYQQAARSAFLLDTAQAFHDDIYSKLFQN